MKIQKKEIQNFNKEIIKILFLLSNFNNYNNENSKIKK